MHGRVLIYAWTGAYIYAWTGAYICMDGCLYMHGRVLIYAWMGAYICMDGCLYCIDGCLAIIYWVSARYHLIHAKFSGPDSFADRLPLHILLATVTVLMPLTTHPQDRLAQERVSYTAKIIAKGGMSYTVFISVYYYIRLNYGIV